MLKTTKRVLWSTAAALLITFGAGCAEAPYPSGLYAELNTTRGMIVLSIDFERAPMTAANFVGLAEGNIRNSALGEGIPFFDGTVFHRVVSGHVIQAGAPPIEAAGGPGYTFPNEIHPELSHDHAGALGMANGGPHTNGSQFYITLGDRSYLDGDYTVFGEVHTGMDVVERIEQGDMIEKVGIVRIGRKAGRFRPETSQFDRLVSEAKERVRRESEEKERAEAEALRNGWPESVETPGGVRFVITREGEGPHPAEGESVLLLYSGRGLLPGLRFVSQENGRPDDAGQPARFRFVLGRDSIHPGFDEGIADMRRGEKRTLIVPAALAYGESGFYGRTGEGGGRFVISPRTALVYQVERLDGP